MFKRKLTALDFVNVTTFDAEDEPQFRNLIVWLEDQKIRHYKIEDRDGLRDIQSSNWLSCYNKYIYDIGCPVATDNKNGILDWLLGFAVRLEYGDNIDKYKTQTAETVKNSQSNVPKVISQNPLDSMDFNSVEVKSGIETLQKLLNITPHPDHLVTLKAVSRLIKQRLSTEVVQNPEDHIVSGKTFQLKEMDTEIDSGDNILNDAVKILRLLYIHDLRNLQTKINECIVASQELTANPKTDTKLGKVGF